MSAWNNTYGYKSTVVNCSNNLPRQDKEKFIPVVINSILNKKKIPIYGDGKQKREWIFVDDFVESIEFIILNNLFRENFTIGSGKSFENRTLAKKIIQIFREKLKYNTKHVKLVRVIDRPGHDREYKINCAKIKKLGWRSKTNINKDLLKTINFYRENR